MTKANFLRRFTERWSLPSWLQRFGVWGFCFFFVKGLLWLTVPSILLWLGLS